MKFRKRFDRFAEDNAGVIARTAKAISDAKGKWMREVMETHLPAEMCALADSKNPQDLVALKNYLMVQSIREDALPGGESRLMRGEQLLGSFKVDIRKGKIAVLAKVEPKAV